MRSIIKAVHVRAIRASATRGVLVIGHLTIPCVLGRSGCSTRKREGDCATPVGRWRFGPVLRRTDRTRPPTTSLTVRPVKRGMGWCDEPMDRNYNRAVSLPYPASHEELWREDGLYDIVVTLSHNSMPRVAGLGSAVFFHVASADGRPTAGCVAISARDMSRVLPFLGRRTELVIGGAGRPSRDGQISPTPPARAWLRKQ